MFLLSEGRTIHQHSKAALFQNAVRPPLCFRTAPIEAQKHSKFEMAESSSIRSSILNAIQSTKSVCDTIRSFNDRDKNLGRLAQQLAVLHRVLNLLDGLTSWNPPVFTSLQGPIDRCREIQCEVETSMIQFRNETETTYPDWRKMKFIDGSINGFIDRVDGYKSTFLVGLGIVLMSEAAPRFLAAGGVLAIYNELVLDTKHYLRELLRRIDERLGSETIEYLENYLKVERDGTLCCLLVCDMGASSSNELLRNQESQQATGRRPELGDGLQNFKTEAPIYPDTFGKTFEGFIHCLKFPNGSDNDGFRSWQCVGLHRTIPNRQMGRRVYSGGSFFATDGSEQVVVDALPGYFYVGSATSTHGSQQLIGTMPKDTLSHLVTNRYAN